MKNEEIKSMSTDELMETLKSEQDNLTRLRFAHAISPIENPTKIRTSRKTIARIKTALRAQELANN
ncbi:MAG: 50S ribosomal protein L29 [Tunicatimonas sp.]|uniref:50S ribosomal protein L29 n=1 Tax=Tunicatimonas sp. TaxID=1940096 RepID=UPI003C724C5F